MPKNNALLCWHILNKSDAFVLFIQNSKYIQGHDLPASYKHQSFTHSFNKLALSITSKISKTWALHEVGTRSQVRMMTSTSYSDHNRGEGELGVRSNRPLWEETSTDLRVLNPCGWMYIVFSEVANLNVHKNQTTNIHE